MLNIRGFFLINACVLNALCETEAPVVVNNTREVDPALYEPTVAAVQTSELRTLKNCSLVPEFPEVRHQIATLATVNKLIKIKVVISGETGPLNETYPVSVYNPHQWTISTSLTGNSVLVLKEYYDAMSLWTLGHGVTSATLKLIQNPDNCLKDAHVEEIENTLRLQFLTNFDADDELPEESEICNAHVQRVEGSDGRIVYVCCSRSLDNMLHCSVLRESIWFKLLFALILLLQILTVLYSPYLIPKSISSSKTDFPKYIFTTEPGKELKLNVKKINEKEHVSGEFKKTIQHSFSDLSNFKRHLQTMVPGKVYTVYVKSVDMAVRRSKIIAEGNAPVSVLSFITNFFVRCKLRDEESKVTKSKVRKCCNQKMLKPTQVKMPWYRCLRFFMMIFMIIVSFSPWILRVWFYYAHEEEAIRHQKSVMQNRNMTFPYTGNILSYISPSNWLYTGIYIFLSSEFFIYKILPLPNSVKRMLKRTVRMCIRDINDTPKLIAACDLFAIRMLWPLQKFGVLGCFVLPLWLLVLPFCLLLLSLEVLPIVDLTVRLLVNAIYYTVRTIKPDIFNSCNKLGEGKVKKNIIHQEKPRTKNAAFTKQKIKSWVEKRLVIDNDETNYRRHQFIKMASLILSLVTILVILFLIFDCIAFFVECAFYALVGFILNPGDTMKYVSLILLIAVYGNECFSGVHKKYAAYSKSVNTVVQSMVGDKISEEASKTESKQENVAFRVPNPDVVCERMCLVAGSEGYLKWRADRLALFLDNSDIPYIPKLFFFKVGKLKHPFCPGVVHLLYLKALLEFMLILGFLMFVVIVIFAFGQAQDISSGGQTIAALGSGFLPLILRKFLFQTHVSTGVDKSNMKWKYMFSNEVQNFSTRWNFSDINVTHVEELDLKTASVTGGTSNIDTVTEGISEEDTSLKLIEKNTPRTSSAGFNDSGGASNADIVTAGISAEDTSVELIQETHPITEENIVGNVDLIVKSATDNKDNEIMTFYVPRKPDDDVERVFDENKTEDETFV